MANPRGSVNGPFYPLGKFTIAAAGATQALNANVPITDATGTPTGGVPGTSIKGSPSPLKCSELKVMTPGSNTGNIFIITKGPGGADTAAANSGVPVLLVVQPGQERSLNCSQTANGFTLDQLLIDTDVAGSVCWIDAIIS
jgi:hypothetical protein